MCNDQNALFVDETEWKTAAVEAALIERLTFIQSYALLQSVRTYVISNASHGRKWSSFERKYFSCNRPKHETEMNIPV